MQNPKRRKLIKLSALLLASTQLSAFSFGSKEIEKIPNIGKSLIIYYSHTNRTKKVAQDIKNLTGADIIQIEPQVPYTMDYKPHVEQIKQEQKDNHRPKIKTKLPDISAYDTVFIGFPTWWYHIPMPFFTMFEAMDFSGKNIVPFCTHGGTGFSDALKDIRSLEPNAKLYEGLEVLDEDVQSSKEETKKWLISLGFEVK